jgi:hypothetical protein
LFWWSIHNKLLRDSMHPLFCCHFDYCHVIHAKKLLSILCWKQTHSPCCNCCCHSIVSTQSLALYGRAPLVNKAQYRDRLRHPPRNGSRTNAFLGWTHSLYLLWQLWEGSYCNKNCLIKTLLKPPLRKGLDENVFLGWTHNVIFTLAFPVEGPYQRFEKITIFFSGIRHHPPRKFRDKAFLGMDAQR